MPLPEDIRARVFEAVFQELDDFSYLTKSRAENAELMNRLVDHPEVGTLLKNYISNERVRTYIKDTIINRYAKVRTELPQDICVYLNSLCSEKLHEIDYLEKDQVSLHRTESGIYYAVARSKRQHTS